MCWREGLGVVKGECFSGLSPQVWKSESRGSVPPHPPLGESRSKLANQQWVFHPLTRARGISNVPRLHCPEGAYRLGGSQVPS